MGGCELFHSPFSLSNMTFPLEYDLTICDTLSSGMCLLSSPNVLDIELTLYEAILEDVIMDS
jgi:hypothetical protein